MTASILGSLADSTLESQLGKNRFVGGGVPLDVLRSLYLDNMATKGQVNSSLVTFPRIQQDFPPVQKINMLNKKRILVTGVSDNYKSGLLSFQFTFTNIRSSQNKQTNKQTISGIALFLKGS